MNFKKWIETLLSEKGIDQEQLLEIESAGVFGNNFMPVSVIVDAMKAAPAHEQAKMKTVLVKIDFLNGDVLHFLKHLGKALAI